MPAEFGTEQSDMVAADGQEKSFAGFIWLFCLRNKKHARLSPNILLFISFLPKFGPNLNFQKN